VGKLVAAAREELRTAGFAAMTIRTVAARADVAPATAYTYFSSKHHLVVEVFWRSIHERSHPASPQAAPADRVAAVFEDLARFLAGDPELGRAATYALLRDEPDVKPLRELIGTEINDRIAAAAGAQVEPDVMDALSMAWSGAMLQSGMGHFTYPQMAERLVAVARLLLGGAR
jgi:AcrR family transcriptional regulator